MQSSNVVRSDASAQALGRAPTASCHPPCRLRRRRGKALLLFLVALPVLLAVAGLVIDWGSMLSIQVDLRHATDAAALAAAVDVAVGESPTTAASTSLTYVRDYNGHSDADVAMNSPPVSGPFAGRSGFVEVVAEQQYPTKIMHLVGDFGQTRVKTRSVAGTVPSTAGAAVVVLNPRPPAVSVGITLPISLNFPALLGGLEVLGVGPVRVNGAVLVNTSWGGVDENGNAVGTSPGPPYGISCTPLLPLTRLRAQDVRVVGGVDDQDNYASFTTGRPNPLQANRLPVVDPYRDLPIPSEASDPANVDSTNRGGVRVAQLPLIGPTTTLRPGVYDYIEIVSGTVVFQPGIYVIRGASPLTGLSLSIVGGMVTADGVMFYVTASTFDSSNGAPDLTELGTTPSAPQTLAMLPSVVVNAALPGNRLTPLTSGPFKGLLIYQRRNDFRPIVITSQELLGTTTLSGTVYSKWGHAILAANGDYDLRFVVGSLRFASLLGITLNPSQLLPPARDVYLVE
ncbi:MAG: pilus assembly protein TadG-related protein [Pirellulales bacterium]